MQLLVAAVGIIICFLFALDVFIRCLRSAFYRHRDGIFYGLKWLLAYVALRVRRRLVLKPIERLPKAHQLGFVLPNLQQKKYYTDQIYLDEVDATADLDAIDRPMPLADDPFALDDLGFIGVDQNGTTLLIRLARRPARTAEIWLFLKNCLSDAAVKLTALKTAKDDLLKIPDVGCFQHTIHPAAHVSNTDGSTFTVGGLRIEMRQPQRRWKVQFSGQLRKIQDNTTGSDNVIGELQTVQMSFQWRALASGFSFNVDGDPALTADALAREGWSSHWLRHLLHTTPAHYEQPGQLLGMIKLGSLPPNEFRLRGLRRHLFGVLDWRSYERCISHRVYSEDGNFFNVTCLSKPEVVSYMQSGFLVRPNALVLPVTSTDLTLPAINDYENCTQHYSFSFTTKDNYSYSVQCDRTFASKFLRQNGSWSVMLLNFCQCEITDQETGKKRRGYGVTEFCYRPTDTHSAQEMAAAMVETSLPTICIAPWPREPRRCAAGGSKDRDEQLLLQLGDQSVGHADLARLAGGKGLQLTLLKHLQALRVGGVSPVAFEALRVNTRLSEAHRPLERDDFGRLIAALQAHPFSVPDGCVLTTHLFDCAVRPLCEQHLKRLKNAVCRGQLQLERTADIDNCLQQLDSAIDSVHLDSEMRSQLKQLLSESELYAVRSSAADEDGVDVSSAGQEETVLGVRGLVEKIEEAVRTCWKSHFSWRAIQYRHRNGLAIDCAMAVVVQQMVDADTAGVLFTIDPVTLDQSHMVVNANFGLGESVVSGTAEPDTFEIERSADGSVGRVTSSRVGAKAQVMRLKAVCEEAPYDSDTSGLEHLTPQVTAHEANQNGVSEACLNEQTLLRLAHTGLLIEKLFGSSRDIEFAINNGHIYLLQARPITATDGSLDDWEWEHEFDVPLSTDEEWITTANMGEVMPNALSPLSLSLMGSTLGPLIEHMLIMDGYQDYMTAEVNKTVFFYKSKAFFNLTLVLIQFARPVLVKPAYFGNDVAQMVSALVYEFKSYATSSAVAQRGYSPNAIVFILFCDAIKAMHRSTGKQTLLIDKNGMEMALAGRTFDQVTTEHLDEYHGHASSLQRLKRATFGFLSRSRNRSNVKLFAKQIDEAPFLPATVDSSQALDQLLRFYPDSAYKMQAFFALSGQSMMYNGLIWSIIARKSSADENALAENYANLALLLANTSNVWSADVPVALQRLADIIRSDLPVEQLSIFISMQPKDAMAWIKQRASEKFVAEFKHFMKKHGHRCLQEMDLHELSWRNAPHKVIEFLQLILRSSLPERTKLETNINQESDIDEAIRQLPLSLTRIQRVVLRYFIRKAREGVRLREWGKNYVVKICDCLREGVRELAEHLIREGRLPEADLIYFLTIYELMELVRKANPKLIYRAIKRRATMKLQHHISYHELNRGIPKEISASSCGSEMFSKKALRGMPVSRGRVQGKARVVLNLTEADQIQPGEILIVPFTDIGWSPYFPLIAGLVTEIGGIISHGAVIARECGIPCIVSCHRATLLFKSGDEVVLNGTEGILDLVS